MTTSTKVLPTTPVAKLSDTRPIFDNDFKRVLNKMPNAPIANLRQMCIDYANKDFGLYGPYLDKLIKKAIIDVGTINTHSGLIRYIDNKRAIYDKYKKQK